MASFDRLARVEMQIVMQHCDKVTLLRLARCSRSTLAAASHRFAWRSLPPLRLECDWPLELWTRIAASLLRHALLFVSWDKRSQPDAPATHGAKDRAVSESPEERDARAEAEAVALAALPGLRHVELRSRSADAARLCSALLARLDHGGAVASLRMDTCDDPLTLSDCESLGALVERSRTLTLLQVKNANMGVDAVHVLSVAVRQSRCLAALDLSGSNIGDPGAIALAAGLAHCRALTDLQLADCGIDDDGIEALVAALEQGECRLRLLNLGNNPNEQEGAAAVARLLASDRCALELLDLSSCAIGEAGGESLAEALQTNRTLTELKLGISFLGTDGTAALLAALQTNGHIRLRHLDLSYNAVDAAGVAALAAYLRTNALEHLNLNGCDLDDSDVTVLAAGLPATPSLCELRLRGSVFGVESAAALAAGLGACPSLTLLDIINNKSLGDAGLAALAPALANLRSLNAGNCNLTFISVALLSSLPHLHSLDLSSNAMGPAGVTLLTASLDSSTPLRSLNLQGCPFGVEGAAALGEALRRGWPVTNLQLGYNRQIDDDGARVLASALEQCSSRCSLHTLNLDVCGLTPAGALALVRAAAAVPSLRFLSLLHNDGIQAADKRELLAAQGAKPHFTLKL